jgi:hypothetical protein
MPTPILIHDVRLVPVVELEPADFSNRQRPLPSGSCREVPEDWNRYWLDSLADSGIVGLAPLRPGSWQVPTRHFTDPAILHRFLAATLQDWGGPEALTDPDGKLVLDGGLALCQGAEVLAEPTCCVDLANWSDWREAAEYRGSDWRMLWIGHPWLSVRFEDERLVLSEPHESATPIARWLVQPADLNRAVDAAVAELEDFADRLQAAVAVVAGSETATTLARKLAGLGA